MKKIIGWSATTLILVLLYSTSFALYRGENAPNSEQAVNRLIVKFAPGAGPKFIKSERGKISTGSPMVDAIEKKYQVNKLNSLLPSSSKAASARQFRDVYIFELRNESDLNALKNELAKNPYVVYTEPDLQVELYETPNDSLYPQQWGLNNLGQEHYYVRRYQGSYNDVLMMTRGIADADIDAGDVFIHPPDKTTAVVVAIIDTGADIHHPDLADNIWTNPREIPDDSLDNDNNGYIDDVHGWDFYTGNTPDVIGDNDPSDADGHGTHCSGIVAAVANNYIGVSGIGRDVTIMPLNFEPLPLVSIVARAILYAADNGADVANMSFGLTSRSDLIGEAISYANDKGVILCAATGNSGTPEINYPAGYDVTIAVGATNDSDRVTSFSTYGTHLDVCAPGLSILSLRAGNTDMYGASWPYEPGVHIIDNKYYLASGTSMACPHVVGVAAWLKSVSPGLTPARAKTIIQQSADDIIDPFGLGWNFPGWDIYSGYGRVNLQKAIEMLPGVRAKITSPQPNEIVAGEVAIDGIADGPAFLDYTIEYGVGKNPDEWTQIIRSSSPVTEDNLTTWDTDGLNGLYTLRLSIGHDNVYYVTVFIANQNLAEITSPQTDATVANYVTFIGNAFAPDFLRYELTYRVDTTGAEWQPIAKGTVPIYNDNIAGWFLEDIPVGDYYVQLAIYNDTGIVQADTVLLHTESIFDTDQAWRSSVAGYPTIVPNYGDIDGDGVNEIIVGHSGGITFYNTDGTIKKEGVPDVPFNNYIIPIAVGRLDNDNIDDFVAIGYDPHFVYGFLSKKPNFNSYLGMFPPLDNYYRSEHEFPKIWLKDIDSDGLDEIIVFIYDASAPQSYIFDSDGSLILSLNYYGEIFPLDMNGDGIDEIYATHQGYGMLRQIDYASGHVNDSLLIQKNGSDFKCLGMSGCDIDHDGINELILYGLYNDYGYWIYAFDEGLELIDGWPHDMAIDPFVVPTVPIFGDIDDDGEYEYLTTYFDLSASYVLAWNLDGTPYIPTNDNGLLATTPEPSVMNMLLVADIDGDNRTDIIACADNDLFNTYKAQRIYAWDNEGKPLAGFPLITVPDMQTSDRFTPCIGDINQDGFIDLMMTTQDSMILLVNYPGSPYNPCTSPAPFWRYNRRMNGIAPPLEDCLPTEISDNDQPLIPETFMLSQNYPNPFNPSTTIEYSLPTRSDISISIYNLLGQKVKTLLETSKPAGRYKTEWDGTDNNNQSVASGLYFYQIKAGDFVESKKMLLLK
jgi:subtilisin family serine protease